MKDFVTPIVSLALVLVSVAALSFAYENSLFSPASPLERQAFRVMQACARAEYKPACYDREIPRLMDEGFSMEEAFEVTRIVQEKTGGYFYCHVLGHKLAAKETAKDPSSWTEVIARCPTGVCSNGCLHGAAQERFRSDVLSEGEITTLLPSLRNVCVSSASRIFSNLEEASCIHSLGHLSMYITGGDIRRSLGICDSVVPSESGFDYLRTCYEGAFMQIFQTLEPEDIALVQHIPAKTTVEAEAFCGTFTDPLAHAACRQESWPLYWPTLQTGSGLESFCSFSPDPAVKTTCYTAMFYVFTAQYELDKGRILSLCESVPEERTAQCFANSASRLIETDYRLAKDAVSLCAIADKKGLGERCYKELLYYSSFNYRQGSEGFHALCSALPDAWGEKCENGEGRFVRFDSSE